MTKHTTTQPKPRRIRGEGSITPVEGKGYRASVVVPGTGKRRAVFGKTPEEASAKLRALMVKVGDPGVAHDLTIEEFLNGWLAEREILIGTKLSPTNFNSYKRAVTNILPHLGKMKLRDLRPAHVKRMLQTLADSGQGRSTVTQTKTNLQKMLRYAVVNDLIPSNPALEVSMKDDINARSPQEAEAITEAMVVALRGAMEGDWMEPMILIGLSLGPRPGELRGLQWKYVDHDAGLLHIRKSMHRITKTTLSDGTVIPEHQELGPLKGDRRGKDPRATPPRAERTLRLDENLVSLFRRQEKIQKEMQLRAGPAWVGNPKGLVFTSETGTPLIETNAQRHLDILTKRAGIGHWDFYSLRHTCASHMRDQGFSAARVADVLGNTERVVQDTHFHSVRQVVDTHLAIAKTMTGAN